MSFPAGFYDALRIEIGNSEGKNWWCVMFPPLCISAADVKLSEAEAAIMEKGGKPSYKLKFKLIEWYEKNKTKIKK